MSITISWTFSGHINWKQQLEELLEASWSNWAASVSFCLLQSPQCILQFEHLTHIIFISSHFTLISSHFSLPLDWAPGRQENVSGRAWLPGIYRALDLLPLYFHHCFPESNLLFLQYGVSHTLGQGYVLRRSFRALFSRCYHNFSDALFILLSEKTLWLIRMNTLAAWSHWSDGG